MKTTHPGQHEVAEAFRTIIAWREGDDGLRRPGLQDTPHRAAKAWFEKTSGYDVDTDDTAAFFKTFETETLGVRGMVIVRDIALEAICEHHLERIWGYAHVAYVPTDRVLGLSKVYRVVNALARRLTVQERLTADIADAFHHNLKPEGVGVVIEARHACMEVRGINQRGQTTVTSELRGCFYTDPSTRSEFFSLARTSKGF